MKKKTAIIIGAGPAGLTAAYELLHRTDIKPIIFEMSDDIGGISKTVNYKGNRIDIGGHRFFSKSDRVVKWWLNVFPLQGKPSRDDILPGEKNAPDPEKTDRVMLIRKRSSKIFFLNRFFDYPISFNLETLFKLGVYRTIKILLSYFKLRLSPVEEINTLEDLFIHRFGVELYRTFFKDYTEKVWGVPCKEIKAEWGRQRIKNLSVAKTVVYSIKKKIFIDSYINNKSIETSLAELFMYPKFGPGQLWEEVARIIKIKGGEIVLNNKVIGSRFSNNLISEVKVKNVISGEEKRLKGDYFISTMPVKELISSFSGDIPSDVSTVAQNLVYRDFVIVGMLLRRRNFQNETKVKSINYIQRDQWIYIQEKEAKLGRLQIFNNWSPYMVKDKNTIWIGAEYFCNESDEIWKKSDKEMIRFAVDDLVKIGFIEEENILDGIVIRMPKTYPAYFGSYDRFSIIRNFTDKFENLFLIGRNGMHRYNNQDHSMLTAMTAVDNIINNIKTKENIWEINTEQEIYER